MRHPGEITIQYLWFYWHVHCVFDTLRLKVVIGTNHPLISKWSYFPVSRETKKPRIIILTEFGFRPPEESSQRTRDVDLMLDWCWVDVVDGGPAYNRHWVNVSYSLEPYCHRKPTRHSDLTLDSYWPNVCCAGTIIEPVYPCSTVFDSKD